MRGKNISSEDKIKVINAKLNNPEKSLRDIEKETWVNRQSSKRILDDTPEIVTSCDKWAIILDRLDTIIDNITIITEEATKKYIESKELTIKDIKDLNDIAKTNFERKQLLTGKATSNVNIIWDILKEIQWQE